MARPARARLSGSTALTALALAGVWAATVGSLLLSGSRWGIWDWDHHFAFAEVERQAILDGGTLPLWNPYIAGGVPILQHPLSSAFSPDFLLVLVLGVPIGLKAVLAFRLAVGLIGGVALGRALGLSVMAAGLLSVLAGASGAYTAHVLYGHAEWSLLGYLPWTLLALIRFVERARPAWGILASVGIALLYLGGGVYHLFALAFFWGAFAVVEASRSGGIRTLVRAALPFVLAGALVGVKLLPAYELFREHPRRLGPMKALFAPAPSAGWREIPHALSYMFLSRETVLPADRGALRHRPAKDYTAEQLRARIPILDHVNFRAYMGLLPLLLLPFAFVSGAWPVRPVAAGTGLLLLLALSDSIGRATGVYPWEHLRALPVLGTLRTSGRFLAVAVTGLAILSALGLRELVRRWKPVGPLTAGVFGGLVLLATAADHGVRNARALSHAFPYEPRPTAPAPEFVTRYLPVDGFDYATVRARVGVVTGHSNLFLRSGVLPQGHPAYRGEAFVARDQGGASLVHARPNEIEVAVDVREPGPLVVNQTWLRGWQRVDRPAPVFDSGGRVATEVVPADRRVRLEYRPPLLAPGLALSAITLLAMGAIAWRAPGRGRS